MATRSIRVNSIQKHSEEGGGGEGCEEHQPLSGDGSREKEKKRREEWSGEHTPMGGVGRGGVFKRTWDVVPLHPTLCMVGTKRAQSSESPALEGKGYYGLSRRESVLECVLQKCISTRVCR